jgi:hypothetical protein
MNRRTPLVLAVALAAAFFAVGCDRLWDARPVEPNVTTSWYWVTSPDTQQLYISNNRAVGRVIVWNTPESLYVKYEAATGWRILKTNMHVDTSLAGIPQVGGNPRINQFAFRTTHTPPVFAYTYSMARKAWWTVGTKLVIAAHASVERTGIDARAAWAGTTPFPGGTFSRYFKSLYDNAYKNVTLPQTTIQMRGWSTNGTYSYWRFELGDVPPGSDLYNGYWNGWCAEQTTYMYPNTWYEVTPWSTLQSGIPPRCQNAGWDNVNYVINHKHPNATLWDTQAAIWCLLGNGGYPTDPEASWMVDQARLNGDGFTPVPGNKVAVVLDCPSNLQLVFMEVTP